MGNPYVISAELDLANAELEQIVRPEAIDGFRESLDADLRSMGKETLWVPSSTMQSGLEQVIAQTALPVVSLDDRYVSSADQFLGISRGVKPQRTTDYPLMQSGAPLWPTTLVDDGYVPRRGYPAIDEQLDKVSSLGKEVLLVDDVLFSGEMVAWLADALRQRGVKIGAVAVGIAIGEGIEKLEAENIEVTASEIFDEVEDEICERDFAVVPGSGRRIESFRSNVLYFDAEYGKPEQWASIPGKSVGEFAVRSFGRAAELIAKGTPISALGEFRGVKQRTIGRLFGPEVDAAEALRFNACRFLPGKFYTNL